MEEVNIQTVNLTGYKAQVNGAQYLRLGTWDSYGIEQLQIVPGPEWTGLVIKAVFVTAAGTTPVVVPDSGLINVPPEATAQALGVESPGMIVFSGVTAGVQRITCNLLYLVSDHAPIDGEAPEPTPDQWAQFVAMVQQYAQQASQSATAAADSATTAEGSATQANQSAAAAGKSAQDAAAELEKVQGAGSAALQAIGTAQNTATQEVQNAQQSAVQAVEQAGTTQVGAVNTAGQAQKTAIQQAGEDATKQVQDAGTEQVKAVNTAGDAKLQQIEEVNALLPTPTEADAGKAPIAQPDGTYALEQVTVDAYTKAEADARYAPIEAAIKVSGKGTGLVSLSPTVGWYQQGLALYGRAWQDGTPSVETEVPIQDAGDNGTVDVTVNGANLFNLDSVVADLVFSYNTTAVEISEKISFQTTGNDAFIGDTATAGATAGTRMLQLVFAAEPQKSYHVSLSATSLIKNFVTFLDKNNVSLSYSSFSTNDFTVLIPEKCVKVALRIGTGNAPVGTRVDTTIMVNAGDTAQPYQPYTAQQLPIPTPDGLPGVPVDSGGTWTDENGQQWVSDVVNLDAGTLTQYCGQIASYAGEEISTPYISSTGALTTGAQVVYTLLEPITTPLDADTIAAYRALQSYPGTTNVLAPDCGIEASALADPNQWVQEQIQAAITQAVTQAVALTGGNT